ncbi:MAG: hypothetical protein EOP04_13905, partial [Proteobacteria bacterium]
MKHMFLLAIQGLVVLGACASFAQVDSAGSAPSAASTDSTVGAEKGQVFNGDKIQTAAGNLSAALHEPFKSTVVKEFTYLTNYSKVQLECADRESKTEFVCRENTNPTIVKAMPLIQAAISAMGVGAKDACSSFGKAMDIANKALLTYQGVCASTKAYCQYACGDAATNLKKSYESVTKSANGAANSLRLSGEASSVSQAKKIEDLLNVLKTQVELDLNKEQKESVVGKNKTCTGFDTQLAAAMAGGIGVLSSMGKANECDKKLAATAMPTPTPVDCTVATNKANNMECICKDAPRTPGCTGGLHTALSAHSADSMRSAD